MSSLCSRPVRSLLLARAPAYRFIAVACSLALLPLALRRVIRRALTARACSQHRCSQLHGTLHCSQWRQANFCVVYSRGTVRAKLPLWDQHVIRGGPHTGLAPPAIAQLNKGQRCSLADSTYPQTHFLQAPLDTSHPPLSLPTSPSRRRRGQLFFPLWSFPHPQLQALPTSKPFCHPHSLQLHQPLVHLAWWFATQGSPCPQSSCRLSVTFPLWSCTGFRLPLPGLNLEDCAHGNCHCCRPTKAKRSRKTVADVSTWLLCFNRYVAAMCSVYPGMLPQMLAYSNMIIQAQLQFSGDGWLADL